MATIPGGTFSDVLQVTDTDFGLFGGGGADLLLGAGSDDGLDGGTGNDVLFGAGGNDNLTGGTGNDLLFGGGDDDYIIGGTGNDVIVGGDGNDVFLFGKKSGKDIIGDFSTGDDVLQILKSKNIKNVADVIKNAKQHGDNLVITLGKGQTITLQGVSKADFKTDAAGHIVVT